MEEKKAVWEKVVAGFLVVLVVLGLLLFVVLVAVISNEGVKCWMTVNTSNEWLECLMAAILDKRDVMELIGRGIAGIVLIWGAVWGAVAVIRRAATQAKIADAQVENNELIEKEHVQKRLEKAIENLRSGIESERIASFHEFYYLARDYKERREEIFNILCERLQHITPAKESSRKVKFSYERKITNTRPTNEVQKLLNVLFQFKDNQEKSIFVQLSPNLRGLSLVGADLRGANLQNANMEHADLLEARLCNANLQAARLSHADFQRAELLGTNLQDAKLFFTVLRNARLWDANLRNADLQGANFQNAKLQNVDLQEADMRKTILHMTELQGANLRGADLEGADLRNADLEGADLEGANLLSAVLVYANLQSAKLRGAKLRGANLSEAELQNADLRRVDLRMVKNLKTAILSGAKVKHAKFPKDYKIPDDVDNRSGFWSFLFHSSMRLLRKLKIVV